MKEVSILGLAHSKFKVVRSKIWFAVCLVLLIVSIVVGIPSVLAQITLDVDAEYELTFVVTSTTALWDPGTHSIEMSGVGQLSAPIVVTFTINGTGTATYSMVGGGNPPGEFNLNMELSGYLEDSFFTGAYTMSVVAHGTTVILATTPTYVRTEEIVNLSANGTFNELTWNATSSSSIMDFSSINGEGTEFELRVTGSSHVIPEFPLSIVLLVIVILLTLVAVIISEVHSRERVSSNP
ncbi:MAG: hypothetical protein JSW14_06405 [Candidatus Bathyarchaeum sp.]|nr:MAG: hypothetical protein JSW14_06405 [Candidatus Bathyarchaeum sp.]